MQKIDMGTTSNKFIFLFVIVLSGLFINCKKRPFDYRNKYVGDWKFTYSTQSCSYSPSLTCDNQSGEYDGKVIYDKKDGNRNAIEIYFAPGWIRYLEINDNGVFTSCGADGKFDGKKSISLKYAGSSSCTGALGSSSSFTIIGTKK